jgi:ABC-2 type transport system ATP-binding protein
MEEAEYCDRLLIMREGDILTSGTPAEIKQQVRSVDLPEPTMEDAFIQLVEAKIIMALIFRASSACCANFILAK